MELLKNQAQALEQAKEALMQENERVQMERDNALIEITTSNVTLNAQSVELSDTQKKLAETHQALLDRNQELTQVQAEIQPHLIALKNIESKYEQELSFFTSKLDQMKNQSGVYAFNGKMITADEIARQIEESEALCLEANRMFGGLGSSHVSSTSQKRWVVVHVVTAAS